LIGRVLKDLGRIEGVNGSLVVGKDGLIIERDVSSDIDSELVGAMSSAVFGTAERSSEEMKKKKKKKKTHDRFWRSNFSGDHRHNYKSRINTIGNEKKLRSNYGVTLRDDYNARIHKLR